MLSCAAPGSGPEPAVGHACASQSLGFAFFSVTTLGHNWTFKHYVCEMKFIFLHL